MIRRLLITLALLAAPALAQQGNTLTLTGAGAPVGSCSFMFRYVDSTNNDLYFCSNSVWVKANGGGGGTPGGSNLQFQYNNAGAFAGSLGLTYDTTLLMPLMQVFQMSESTASSNPSSGNHWVYVDTSTAKLTCRNSDGSSCIAAGAGTPGGSTDAVQYNAGAGVIGGVNSPTTNGLYNLIFNVTGSAAVVPTATLPGVPVNAQSASYPLVYSDRASYIKYSGGTTATLTLPQVTGNTASNFPFITQNLNSGNLTMTPNAADKCDNGSTGVSCAAVLPSWAAFVYQDSSSAPGNWWTVNLPTFAAFGATGALCSWSTSTGFSCGNATGDVTTAGSKAFTLASLNINATAADYVAGGGTAQAQTATMSPALSANTTGVTLKFLPTAANTAAAPTLAVNGLTAKNVTKCGTVALVAGDLTTTAIAEVTYDGTEWVLLNPQNVPCGIPSAGVYFAQNQNSGGSGVAVLGAGNASKIYSFVSPITCIGCTKIIYSVNVADNSANLYNIALFIGDSSVGTVGNIACQTGAVAGTVLFPSTGLKTAAWAAACNIIANKRYYIGWTAVTATAIIGGSTPNAVPLCSTAPTSNNTTSAAVWTTPIGIPADSYSISCVNPTFGFGQ